MASVIARAHDGSILGSRSMPLMPSSLLDAEAKACLLAVMLTLDNRWKFCSFEGDAKLVIQACCSFESCSWEIRHIVRDILHFANHFLAWEFSFVHREANALAHVVATMATNLVSGD